MSLSSFGTWPLVPWSVVKTIEKPSAEVIREMMVLRAASPGSSQCSSPTARHNEIVIKLTTARKEKRAQTQGKSVPPVTLDGDQDREEAQIGGTDATAGNIGSRSARKRRNSSHCGREPTGGQLSEAEADQHLRDQWDEENDALSTRYQTQLEEDRAIQDARREEEMETDFKQGVGVGYIPQQIHPYARKLMVARKYIPLWYFLPEATAKAKDRSREMVDTNRFQIAMEDGGSSSSSLTLVGSHVVRASPNAIPDTRLTWDQVMRAKSSFLNALPLGEFTEDFIKMFAGFYTGMDMHPELREEQGDKVLALYHAEMRRAWLRTLRAETTI
ncbi:hypothetical protein F5050DRAFT_1813012 [Lentinula boryana]|uniref:Retrotransposon gag domain-containing protein n=1 Tax=Lentinula boryana TaxID=40481 RepID=A0ABQ8PXG3_9AGAR|nr:hypothetical protein F5050DRAFT_1813012 [Lentinula boryana]